MYEETEFIRYPERICIVDMAMNGSGTRDTGRVFMALSISISADNIQFYLT